MLRGLTRIAPTRLVSALGQLQFRSPFARLALETVASRVAQGQGSIRRGVGRGLQIDATGSNVGYLLGTAELPEQNWLSANLNAGDTLYDLGASIGFFTLIAAKIVGPTGRVWAFEPLPDSVTRLRKNLDLNAFQNVTVVPCAVSDHSGSGRMVGIANRARLDVAETEESANVSVTTIDAWRSETDAAPPTVIKIDVEGAEIDVLRGAEETIAESLPLLLIEVHWLGPDFVDYVGTALGPLGYDAESLGGGPLPREPVRFHAVLSPKREQA
jgi:FkbM family methyltransferase